MSTKLSTTGGFLRAGNVTLLIGVEEERVDECHEKGYAAVFNAIQIFEPAWYLRGLDNLLCDMISDEEMAEADAEVSHDEIQKDEPKKKRGSRKKADEDAGEDPYPGAKEPFEKARAKVAAEKEKPAPGARSRRISQTLKEEREEVMKENMETLVNVPEGEDAEVPFEEKGPELKPLPKRKSRKKAEEPAEAETPAEVTEEPAEATEEPEEKPVRRRGRRRA